MDGSGTKDDPWHLTTAPGRSAYEMFRDEAADPPLLLRAIEAWGRTEDNPRNNRVRAI